MEPQACQELRPPLRELVYLLFEALEVVMGGQIQVLKGLSNLLSHQFLQFLTVFLRGVHHRFDKSGSALLFRLAPVDLLIENLFGSFTGHGNRSKTCKHHFIQRLKHESVLSNSLSRFFEIVFV